MTDLNTRNRKKNQNIKNIGYIINKLLVKFYAQKSHSLIPANIL